MLTIKTSGCLESIGKEKLQEEEEEEKVRQEEVKHSYGLWEAFSESFSGLIKSSAERRLCTMAPVLSALLRQHTSTHSGIVLGIQ
jgi:hypothetical protein